MFRIGRKILSSNFVHITVLCWLWIIAISVPVAIIGVRATDMGSSPPYLLMVVVLLFFWALNAILAVIYTIKASSQKQYGRAACLIGIPVCLVAFIFYLPQSLYMLNEGGDEVRFFFLRTSFLKDIAATARANIQPKLIVWDSGGMIGASRAYVYDESDEINLPPDKRSAAWLERAYKTELSCGPIQAMPILRILDLTTHFYLARLPC